MNQAESTEIKILLSCARCEMREQDRQALIVLLERKPEWTRLLELANKHGLIPLLHEHLKTLPASLVPHEVHRELHYFAGIKAKHNFLLAAELLKVKQIFDACAIKFFAFKGPCLSVQAYRQLSLRVFLDLDLIIDGKDFPQAQARLLSAGYELEPRRQPQLEDAFLRSELFRRFSHEQAFARRESGRDMPSFVLDIHWRGGEPSVVDFNWSALAKYATEITVCGQSIPTLKPEMQLLLLSVHGTKHQWQQLKWLVDIAELIKSTPSLDWKEVYALASREGVARKIDLAVRLCADASLIDSQVAGWVKDRFRTDHQLAQLSSWTSSTWSQAGASDGSLRLYWRYHACTFDNIGRAARFLLTDFCSPTLPTYLFLPLPAWLSPLYYLIHPSLLMWNFLFARLTPNEHRTPELTHVH